VETKQTPGLVFSSKAALVRIIVLACVGLVVLGMFLQTTRAWSAQDFTPPMDCGYSPSSYGQAAGTWNSQAMVETPNNSDFDCALMYVEGYWRGSSSGYHYLGYSWLGYLGPQLNGFGDVVEVSGLHNICDVGWTNCHGYESTLVYQ
jgi:hypothetical protein